MSDRKQVNRIGLPTSTARNFNLVTETLFTHTEMLHVYYKLNVQKNLKVA